MDTTMTVRLNADEKALINDYAKAMGTSASDLMRRATLESIEDAIDLEAWENAKREFDENPVVHTTEEVVEMFK